MNGLVDVPTVAVIDLFWVCWQSWEDVDVKVSLNVVLSTGISAVELHIPISVSV